MPPEGKHLLHDEDGLIFDTGLGTLFQRCYDGSVKIAQGGTTNKLGPGMWATADANMCARGETSATLEEALRFHGRRE